MIAKILGKIGLPLLVKYLGKALSGMNCTVAQEAGQMLGSVDDAIQTAKFRWKNLKRQTATSKNCRKSKPASTIKP